VVSRGPEGFSSSFSHSPFGRPKAFLSPSSPSLCLFLFLFLNRKKRSKRREEREEEEERERRKTETQRRKRRREEEIMNEKQKVVRSNFFLASFFFCSF